MSIVQKSMSLLLVAGSLGCATVSHRDQTLTFDTTKGQVRVYESAKSKTAVASAPGIYVPKEGAREKVYFETKAGGRRGYEPKCDVRWGSGLGGNALAALAFGAATSATGGALALVAFVGIDFGWTDEGFDCTKTQVVETADLKLSSPSHSCIRAVLLPPRHPEARVSDAIATGWLKSIGRSKTCNDFVDYEKSKDRLYFFNVDHESMRSPEQWNRNQLGRLASEFGVTHAISLVTKRTRSGYVVKPAVFNIIAGKSEIGQRQILEMERDVRVRHDHDQDMWRGAMHKTISLIPNSVFWGPSTSELDRGEKIATERNTTYTALVTNLGFTHVSHPDAYDIWDLAYGLSPSYKFGSMSSTFNKDGEDRELFFGYLAATFDATATAHTPIGAFRLGAGAGFAPILYFKEDSRHQSLLPIVTGSINYTAFVNDNIFFTATSEGYQVAANTEYFGADQAKLRVWSVSSVGLGYFFPTLRHRVAGVAERYAGK